MSEKESDIQIFIEDITKRAGSLALEFYGKVSKERKQDSIVSEADRTVEKFLVSKILERFPEDYILMEEYGTHGNFSNNKSQRWWAIDPIDGTGPFLSNLPFWSVSVAMLQGSEVVCSSLNMPLLGMFFSSRKAGRTTLNGDSLSNLGNNLRDEFDFSFVPCSPVNGLSIKYPGKRLALAASSVHIAFVACGSAKGAIIEPNRAYDIAAASLILEQVGGCIKYLDGTDIDFAELHDGQTMKVPVIASHPEEFSFFQKEVFWK
ncbi:MAG: inositol monophosphatase family protein [bacterium]